MSPMAIRVSRSYSLPADLDAQITQMAEQKNIPRSHVMKEALKVYLQNNKDQ